MTQDEIIEELKTKNMSEVLEIIEDAEKGFLEELELAEGIGLLHDERLNEEVLKLLEKSGVKIIYVKDEE